MISTLAVLITLMSSAQAQTEIVGGKIVRNIKEVPYIIFASGCDGSLIHPSWILTAAHCERLFAPGKVLFGGSTSPKAPLSNPITLTVEKAFVHPNAKRTNRYISWDYMLVKLTKPVTVSTDVKTVALPDQDFLSRKLQEPGVVATVYGWGLTKEGGDLSSVLRKVDVPIVDSAIANEPDAYDGDIDNSMITAGYAEGKKDACNGDSGGPLIVRDKLRKRDVLIGIVSWGEGCARPNKYGVYSRVSLITDWVKDTIRKNR